MTPEPIATGNAFSPAIRPASSRAVSALAFTLGFSLSTIGSAIARPADVIFCAACTPATVQVLSSATST